MQCIAVFLLNVVHFPDALHADISALVADQITGIGTENAGRLILLQDYFIIIQIDFQLVTNRNIQRTAQFDGKHDSA